MTLIQYPRARTRTQRWLLEATAQELLRCGYDHLTVTGIAATANVGRGTFYRYFPSVDDAILAIFEQEQTRLYEEIYALMAQYESPEKEQRAWTAVLTTLAERKPFFMALASPKAWALWERLQAAITRRFEESLATGAFLYPMWMNLPLDVMASFTAGAVTTLIRRWMVDELAYDAATMGRMIYQLLYHVPD